MTYNFDNIAIKCNTWQQMERLAEIADRQGYYKSVLFGEEYFNDGDVYFMLNTSNHYINDIPFNSDNIITFTTFITSHPDYRVEGC